MDCIPGSDNELLQVLQRLALGEDRVQISDVVPKPGLHDSTCCVVLGAFRGTGDGRRCSQRVRRVGHEMQKNINGRKRKGTESSQTFTTPCSSGSTGAPSSIRQWAVATDAGNRRREKTCHRASNCLNKLDRDRFLSETSLVGPVGSSLFFSKRNYLNGPNDSF